jgi:hypothetical protein
VALEATHRDDRESADCPLETAEAEAKMEEERKEEETAIENSKKRSIVLLCCECVTVVNMLLL